MKQKSIHFPKDGRFANFLKESIQETDVCGHIRSSVVERRRVGQPPEGGEGGRFFFLLGGKPGKTHGFSKGVLNRKWMFFFF